MVFLEKRFGTTAIKSGFITKDQLQETLGIQVEENVEGKTHRLIGSILLDRGYINDEQANKVLLSLKRE